MKILIFIYIFFFSSICYLSGGSDNNYYFSYEVINQSNWINVAKKIFQSRFPLSITIIPHKEVLDKENSGKEKLLVLIKSKNNNLENPTNNTNIESPSTYIPDSPHMPFNSFPNIDPRSNSNINPDSNHFIPSSIYPPPMDNSSDKNNSSHNIYPNIPGINSSILNHFQPEGNFYNKDFVPSPPDLSDGYVQINPTENPSYWQSSLFVPKHIDLPEVKDKTSTDVKKKEIINYNLKTDEPCDLVVTLGSIIYRTNEQTVKLQVEANKVLCIELEGNPGTGYVWILLGVYDNQPVIDPKTFPTKRNTDPYFTEHISVTQPEELKLSQSSIIQIREKRSNLRRYEASISNVKGSFNTSSFFYKLFGDKDEKNENEKDKEINKEKNVRDKDINENIKKNENGDKKKENKDENKNQRTKEDEDEHKKRKEGEDKYRKEDDDEHKKKKEDEDKHRKEDDDEHKKKKENGDEDKKMEDEKDKKDVDHDDKVKPYDGEGDIVGRCIILNSRIKPHKPGEYYVVYTYYRPFDTTADPNTRIIHLNVV